MSDPTTPEPVVPAKSAAATAPATPAPVTTPSVAETLAADTPVVVVEQKKSRAVGVWSFILGLIAVLADLALIIFVVVTLFSVLADLQAAMQTGEFNSVLSIPGVAGIGVLLFVAFIGGFVVAGLGALLGLIALFTGRGRVIGIFGFLLSAAALGTRIAIITSGLNLTSLNGG
jgi:hypothetical protein